MRYSILFMVFLLCGFACPSRPNDDIYNFIMQDFVTTNTFTKRVRIKSQTYCTTSGTNISDLRDTLVYHYKVKFNEINDFAQMMGLCDKVEKVNIRSIRVPQSDTAKNVCTFSRIYRSPSTGLYIVSMIMKDPGNYFTYWLYLLEEQTGSNNKSKLKVVFRGLYGG